MKISNSSPKIYLLIAILIVAAILRFRDINQPFIDGFSWREASTAMMAENFYRTNWNIFYPEVNWSGPGPNYQGREFQTISYLAALLYVVVGQHDWVGRGLATAFGLWGIFALYQLVRRVWDEQHALVSAAVMAVLPGSIFIERSFLPDPAMVALLTTCLWLLVVYLQTERLKYLGLAILFGMWGCLTKIPGLIVGIPATYAVFAILSSKRKLNPRQIAILGVAMVLTLAPVIGYYLWARYLSLTYPPYHFAGGGFWIWDGLPEWLEQKFFLPQIIRQLRWWLWTTPGMALVLFGLFCLPPQVQGDKKFGPDLAPRHEPGQARWLFHWWFAGFIVFFLVGAHELYANAWNQHIVNPIAATLAGRAIIVITILTTRIARSLLPATPQKLLSIIPVMVTLLLLLPLLILGQRALKTLYEPPTWHADQNYKLGLMLQQISQPDDLVVTLAYALGDPVAIYYSHRRGWVFTLGKGPDYPESAIDDALLPKDDNISIQIIDSLRKQGATWLGIVGVHQDEINQEHPLLLRYLQENCELKQISPDGVIYRFLSPEQTKLTQESPIVAR